MLISRNLESLGLMMKNLNLLREKNFFCDHKISCDELEAGDADIPIHFLVLQTNSSFYQNLCHSGEKLEQYAVTRVSSPPSIVRRLIDLMYGVDIRVSTGEEAAFWKAALELGLEHLVADLRGAVGLVEPKPSSSSSRSSGERTFGEEIPSNLEVKKKMTRRTEGRRDGGVSDASIIPKVEPTLLHETEASSATTSPPDVELTYGDVLSLEEYANRTESREDWEEGLTILGIQLPSQLVKKSLFRFKEEFGILCRGKSDEEIAEIYHRLSGLPFPRTISEVFSESGDGSTENLQTEGVASKPAAAAASAASNFRCSICGFSTKKKPVVLAHVRSMHKKSLASANGKVNNFFSVSTESSDENLGDEGAAIPLLPLQIKTAPPPRKKARYRLNEDGRESLRPEDEGSMLRRSGSDSAFPKALFLKTPHFCTDCNAYETRDTTLFSVHVQACRELRKTVSKSPINKIYSCPFNDCQYSTHKDQYLAKHLWFKHKRGKTATLNDDDPLGNSGFEKRNSTMSIKSVSSSPADFIKSLNSLVCGKSSLAKAPASNDSSCIDDPPDALKSVKSHSKLSVSESSSDRTTIQNSLRTSNPSESSCASEKMKHDGKTEMRLYQPFGCLSKIDSGPQQPAELIKSLKSLVCGKSFHRQENSEKDFIARNELPPGPQSQEKLIKKEIDYPKKSLTDASFD